MLIKQFRNLSQINFFFLIIIAVLLRAAVFVERPSSFEVDFVEPFTKLLIPIPLNNLISSDTNLSLALVFVIIQGLLFNKVLNFHNILGKPTFLPALLFISLSSLFPEFITLSPTLLCNFLVIWMMDKLLSLYQGQSVRFVLFDIGMIIGLGTLIYFPFIGMAFIPWIACAIFRPFIWREWLLGILGFLTIFFFLGIFYLWNDSMSQFYKIWLPLKGSFIANFHITFYDYLALIPLGIILLLGMIHLQMNFLRKGARIRKSFQLLFFIFLLALFSSYLKPHFHLYHFLLCVPAVSVLAAYFFIYEKRRWLYESLYLLLIGCIIALQLF